MQDAEKADVGTKMFRVGGHLEQCRSAGLEQESKENPLVLPDQRHQAMRDAEDQMIVADRKQFALTSAQPLLAGVGLTLGTVAIPAGTVRSSFVAAANASITMSAERRRSAAFDGGEHFELRPRQ
jgi:hypothetical protein